MKADKKGFLLYRNYRESFEELSDEDAGILIKAIFSLADGEEVNKKDLPPMVRLAYTFIGKQLQIDISRYNETCEKRSECGKLGGRPAKEETKENQNNQMVYLENQMKPKKPDIEIDKEKEIEKDIDIEKDKEIEVDKEVDIDIIDNNNKVNAIERSSTMLNDVERCSDDGGLFLLLNNKRKSMKSTYKR